MLYIKFIEICYKYYYKYLNEKYVYMAIPDTVIILEKLPDTKTNEQRKNIINPIYASYNATHLKIVCMFNKGTGKLIEHEEGFDINTGSILRHTHLSNFDETKEYFPEDVLVYYKSIDRAYFSNLEYCVGIFAMWHNNGNLKTLCYYDEPMKVNGLQLEWYPNGIGKMIFDCVDSLCNGDVFNYHSNGNIESCGMCKNCDKVNIWYYFNENNAIYLIRKYLQDITQNVYIDKNWNFKYIKEQSNTNDVETLLYCDNKLIESILSDDKNITLSSTDELIAEYIDEISSDDD